MPPTAPDASPLVPPSLPAAVGPYRVRALLGEGGMGTVYLAEQSQPRREVALKVIRADLASPRLMRRFEREAEVLGRLQHPGIAQVFEAGTAEVRGGADGASWTVPYIAMERVHGVPLTEHPSARGPVRERVALLLQVCDAVHYAHQRGVIHRDLKPGNVLVDDAGRAHVLDFGIARLTDGDAPGDARGGTAATGLGEVLGSLPYMSPEQVTGDPLEVDVRIDVYALGVLLYEVLAGRRPLALEGQTFQSAMRIIIGTEPPRLASVAPAALASAIRGDLETVVATALAKEKERRYASAQALADDLRRWSRDEPIAARPASAMYQLRKLARRNRALAGGAAVAALALVAGTAVSTWQAVRATRAERIAMTERGAAVAAGARAEARGRQALAAGRLAEERRVAADSARRVAVAERVLAQAARAAAVRSAAVAREEADKAAAVSAFLGEMLASGDPERARGRTVTVREVVDQAARRVAGGSLARQPGVEAAVRTSLGSTYLTTGDPDSAGVQLERAYALYRNAAGAPEPALALVATLLGERHRVRGEYPAAESRLLEARERLRRAGDADGTRMMRVLQQLGYVRYAQARHADAERFYRDAIRLGERAVARSRADAPDVRRALARSRERLGEFLTFVNRATESERVLREALAEHRRVDGTLHPDVATTELALAYSIYRQDRPERLPEAAALGREALAHVRVLYGDGSRATADATSRLASVLTDMDSLDAAEPLVRQSVAMRRAMFGDGHIDVAFARTELADLLSRRGRLAEAESLFTQALIAREALVGPRHPAVASSLQDLGILAYARGDTAAGLLRFLRSAEIWREAKLSRPRWADALAAVRGARVAGRTALVDSLLEATAASDTANVHPITGARLLVLLGERLAARGDSAGAEGAWMRAHAWLRGLAAPAGTAERARIAARLAAFYAQRGRPAESAAWRERSAAP